MNIDIVVVAEGDVDCPICLETTKESTTTPLLCIEHTSFCSNCVEQYTSYNINSNQLPIKCPEPTCENIVDEVAIKNITNNTTYKKYQKFQQLKIDPTLLECSQCQRLVAFTNNNNNNNNNNILCECGHEFCYIHGDAHSNPSTTCLEYENSRSSESKQNQELSILAISNDSKNCPNPMCQAPIFKDSGCDHIVCKACNKDFCWKCGTDTYLTGTAFRSCSNCGGSFFDHRYQSRLQCRILICFPLILVAYVIWMVFAIFCCTVSFGCGCCCDGGKSIPYDKEIKGKKSATVGDLFRCVGQMFCAPVIQVCFFFHHLHCCIRCCFGDREWKKMMGV